MIRVSCDVSGRCSLKRVVHPGDFRQSEALKTNRLTGRARMNVHENARSLPASRALLIQRVFEQGWSVREASDAVGISERRSREWIRCAQAGEPMTDWSN